MKIRKVRELASFLKEEGYSPESFAKKLKISNMTIRRWLKRTPETSIPAKYHAALDALCEPGLATNPLAANLASKIPTDSSFGDLLGELEKSGRAVEDLEKLRADVDAKYADKNIGQELREKVSVVLKSIFLKDLPLRYRAICVGAILYFINPVDLIPDTIPIIGYLDDFAVLTLVATMIFNWKSGGVVPTAANSVDEEDQ